MFKLIYLSYYLVGLYFVGLFILALVNQARHVDQEANVFGVLGILFGLPMIFTAWGLSKTKKWARGVAIGFAIIFSLSVIPLFIAGYLIFSKEVKSIFSTKY